MKENFVNEVLWLNTKEKKIFLSKSNYNYTFSNFNDFRETYLNIEKDIKHFFVNYRNKNNINKIPKTFEVIFYWFILSKKITDKEYLKVKDYLVKKDFFHLEKKVFSIYDIVNFLYRILRQQMEERKFNPFPIKRKKSDESYFDITFNKSYIEEKIFNEVKSYINNNNISLKEVIKNQDNLSQLLEDIRGLLEKNNQNIFIIYNEEDNMLLLYNYYQILQKTVIDIIDKQIKKKTRKYKKKSA